MRPAPLALVAPLALAAGVPERGSREPGSDVPNFAEHVAPILYEHCTPCHRPGEVAPFALLTAEDAADHARQIAEVAADRYMPPWLPEPNDPPFAGARRLTDAQIDVLARWAKAGAPAGDSSRAPAPPRFTPGWQLGVPDLVVSMPEPFVVPADGQDLYRNFVIPVPIDAMKHVRAVELRPGNPRVAHHGVLKLDKGDSSRRLDARDPEVGFPEMDLGEAVSPDGQFLGWTPGRTPQPLSEGMSWRLPPDGDLVLQLHLLPSGRPEPIQASVGLFFTDEAPRRLPFIVRLGARLLEIPAGASDYERTDEFTLPVPVAIHAVAPHAHFLGKDVSAWATLPDGARIGLLEVRRWDFSWQDEYRYAEPIAVPAGTKLSMRWRFDNSAANPRNPSVPPRDVRWGPSSLDEMCDLWVQVVPDGRDDFLALQREFTRKDLALLREGYEGDLRVRPEDADLRLSLGLTLGQQGDAAGAQRELEKAVELAPRNARARFHLGRARAIARDVAGAKRELEAVVALEPDHAAALNELGVIAERAGERAEALRLYAQAAAARPKFFVGRVNHGRLLEQAGDDAAAAAEFEAALAIDPRAEAVASSLAWLRAASKVDAARDGARAVALAAPLAAQSPADPAILDLLAAAKAEAGAFHEAVAVATRALELARGRGGHALAAAIESRLRLYRSSKPFRRT